ncbi:MAG: CHRD domain-containing protein [Candidatus Krumholzibacteriales bacterium]
MKYFKISLTLILLISFMSIPAIAAGGKDDQGLVLRDKFRDRDRDRDNDGEEEYEHVFKAHLRGENEVPPVYYPKGPGGLGNFVAHINEMYDSLRVNVLVVNNVYNVVAAHIHLGGPDENGPPVATLYGPVPPGGGRQNGALWQGYILAGDLMGPLEGEPLSKLIMEMAEGNTYVNVHTNDGEGEDNTGPGDMASGEIRGQIELKGMLPPAYARLQVIHNAADPAADTVDVYANGDLLLDDFAFRTATPFMDVPAMVPIIVGVAPGNSMSVDDVIADFEVTLTVNERYVVFANGVLDPFAFAANPDGRDIGFDLFVKEGAREMAMDSANVDFFALHGSTDAPTVDIYARDVTRLVDDAAYGDMTGYLSVPPDMYLLDITPWDNDTTIVATFEADLSGLAGGAAAVFASGFFDPASNGDGPAFGLFAALPNGTVVEFPAVTDDSLTVNRDKRAEVRLDQNYPNPFNPSTRISYYLPEEAHVTLKVFDVQGRVVASLVDGVRPAGLNEAVLNGKALQSGVYFYRLTSGDMVRTRKMIILR